MAKYKLVSLVLLFCTLAFSFVFLANGAMAQVAVDLVYFEGYGIDDLIYVEWGTANEFNTVGFNIWRSLTDVRGEIVGYEPAQGDSILGWDYQFIDPDVDIGTAYWYWLEEIDTNSSSEFHGPIQVIAGIFNTQVPPSGTGTATRTATATTTGLASGSSATRTPTRTPTQTQSGSIFNPTATSISPFLPTGTSGNPLSALTTPLPEQQTLESFGLTEPVAATATLIPLPEITMQFPTAVAAAQVVAIPEGSEQEGTALQPVRRTWLTLERMIFIGFLLLIWVLLGGWFFFSYRQIEK